jgi:hypothetical protein
MERWIKEEEKLKGRKKTEKNSVEKKNKGTVRPDWICMRVVSLESPFKGHHTLLLFNFLIFEIFYKSSKF